MKVLITNDDGIESPGLRALVSALEGEHELWVVAPEGERSGSSLAITLQGAVRMRPLEERFYACNGTPADCVLYACLGALPVVPDVVVSGINLGPNLGTDINYSGTAGAARQAALMGVPAVAISIDGQHGPYNFGPAAEFMRRNLDAVVALWSNDHFLNVNVPNGESIDLPVVLTHPSRRIYRDTLDGFTAPNRDVYYFLHSNAAETVEDPGSDWAAVADGRISVTPVLVHPQSRQGDEGYGDLVLR